jgi:anthranilate synthase component 1
MISNAEFDALGRQGYNRIPLVLETFADLDTPLSLYLKLANKPCSYLLESVVGGERFGRYSFIGLPAEIRIAASGERVTVTSHDKVIETHDGDPLAFVAQYLKRFHAAPVPYATSRHGLRAPPSRLRPRWPPYRTCCCCSPSHSPWWTTFPERYR